MRLLLKQIGLLWVILLCLLKNVVNSVEQRSWECHRQFPDKEGSFIDQPPYWQYNNSCHNQEFSIGDAQQCMKSRTFYVIGNSIAKQAAVDLLALLGGDAKKFQNDGCFSDFSSFGSSCHWDIIDVKIKFLFLTHMDGTDYSSRGGFPYFRYKGPGGAWVTGTLRNPQDSVGGFFADPSATDKWIVEDACSSADIKTCLSLFFEGATDRDVLFVTPGMHYYVLDQEQDDKGSLKVDYSTWLRASALAFRHNINAMFKGKVFHQMLAPINSAPGARLQSNELSSVNEILWDVWKTQPNDPSAWFTIDQWSINTGRSQYYNDQVHFNGILTRAAIFQMLNEMCPGGGGGVHEALDVNAVPVIAPPQPEQPPQKPRPPPPPPPPPPPHATPIVRRSLPAPNPGVLRRAPPLPPPLHVRSPGH